MMELPEAVTLAAQMNERVRGKVLESADCGNSPHKWAFYEPAKETFAGALAGQRVGESTGAGRSVVTMLEPHFALMQGDGGVRVLLHEPGASLPRKRHLTIRFADGCSLTAAVAGWGSFRLLKQSDLADRLDALGVSPVSKAFTYPAFCELVQRAASAGKDSVKKLLISTGGLAGIGNGYLQDILLRAGIHPRRKVADVTGRECRKLFGAITRTLKEAVRLGGRDTEVGLDGRPGGYTPLLDSRAKGRPCPQCGDAIGKIQFLGGSCYFCPACQT